MSKKLEGHYEHDKIEANLYEEWIEKGYFKTRPEKKEMYSILIPPPNITGNLHLGHALDNTIQDAIIRYQRLLGKDVLYLPGMDHAGIATQARVIQHLREQGIDTRNLSRNEFLEKTWTWKDRYTKDIHEQWKLLGLSLDYDYEVFTLDNSMSVAVNKVFKEYYDKGLIYQGYRIINWDPEQKTALSNIEVIHQEIEGAFYYFRYYLENSDEYLLVATTRPETMYADQCLVVNPKDKRYKKYHGKKVINPVNQEIIPIILDEYVDIDFGTGVMKCTPAHDMNDYKIGMKHHLKMPLCMNPDGTMNELALEFKGLDRFVCREKMVIKFKENGLLEKIEKIKHNVGFSERSNVIVEPYLSKQWFVNMKPLAKAAIKQQHGDDKINFYPRRFENVFLSWMENIEDWCISRQLWWGHRIPAYYHKDTGEVLVSETPPSDHENYVQDPDVFDTWFSSALWPFATLGWPEKTPAYQRYFPNSSLVTAYDIIFFWVSRMIFQSKQLTKKKAFDRVIIHGLIRDSKGQKMSKSKGNGIDPRIIIEKYGTDALRHYLLGASSMGQDINFQEDRILESSRYFDKLYNVTRYVLMQLGNQFRPLDLKTYANCDLTYIDQAIISKLNETSKKIKTHMNAYRLNMAIKCLYDFVYDDYCANYVEMSKIVLQNPEESAIRKDITRCTLYYVLKSILVLLSPFAPFLSERLYQSLPNVLESINLEQYPQPIAIKNTLDHIIYDSNLQIIREIRNIRSRYNIPPKELIELDIFTESTLPVEFVNSLSRFLNASVNIYPIRALKEYQDAIIIVTPVCKVYMKSSLKKKDIILTLQKKISEVQSEILRSTSLLTNENFLSKAPKQKIQIEKDKLHQYQKQLESLLLEEKSIL